MTPIKASASTGLVQNALAPALQAWASTASEACPVMMITGMSLASSIRPSHCMIRNPSQATPPP